MSLIMIDGSTGEGGGQILRTALSLSMITGRPFKIERIRANRNAPGLLRQHLTAVKASQAISNAAVEGATLSSSTLLFTPSVVSGGAYQFDIGSAGSTTLVLQTILPALWFATSPSTVTVKGGTHNHAAPPADFLIKTWQPLLAKLGIQQSIELKQHGFYPAGGGEVSAQVIPTQSLQSTDLLHRGELLQANLHVLLSQLPEHIANREIQVIEDALNLTLQKHISHVKAKGSGNAIILDLQFEHLSLSFCGFGKKGVPAESIAKRVTEEVKQYLVSTAVADEYLADQLLLPFALAGKGCFTVQQTSSHFQTNLEIIQKFLPVQFSIEQQKSAYLISANRK